MQRFAPFLIIALSACQTSYDLRFQNEEGGFPEPSVLLENAQQTQQAVASVGRFQGALSCTAFLWKPTGARAESRALALTNGHCVIPYGDRASSYEVWVNRPVSSEWKLLLNYFIDTQENQKPIAVRSIPYATMKTVDLALLELEASWAELEQAGFHALPQATRAAPAGSAIRTVGVPGGDIPWEEQFLREARCVEETRRSLVEWYWAWFDTHRNSCADIKEGSSGSPVLNEEGAVYAVIHTTSAGGISESCYLGNPCELQRPGAVMVAQKNYAIDIVGLGNCFDKETLRFGSDCPLPPPDSLAFEGAPHTPTRPVNAQGEPIQWTVTAKDALWKMGPAGDVDCQNKKGYQSGELPSSALPRDNGVYLLCLQKPGADPRFPSVVVVSIDTKPPTLKPKLSMMPLESGLRFEPLFQVPELSFYYVGFGPLASTDCETLPLQVYRRIPVRIPGQDLPARICVRGEDHAGNPGPVFAYDLTAEDVSGLRTQMRTKASGQKAKEHDVIRKQ